MEAPAQVVGRIGALPHDYLIIRGEISGTPFALLESEGGNERFLIARAYQGNALGSFVVSLVPASSSSAQDSVPIDVPIITMEQYGNEPLPSLMEGACKKGNIRGATELAAWKLDRAAIPSRGSGVTILGSHKKPSASWKDLISGVLHDELGNHYFVITRTAEHLGKMHFAFLQDKFAQVWHVRGQRMRGWLKKILEVDLFSSVGLNRQIRVVATQEAADRTAGSALRWLAIAEQCQSSIIEAPATGIFAGMQADFFWRETDTQGLITEPNCPGAVARGRRGRIIE